jgi:glycosyltransferase involved in cell wall biosynthesis
VLTTTSEPTVRIEPARAGRGQIQQGSAPIRLLNVVPTLLCGGTEKQVMTLSRALDPERYRLEFACLRRWGPFIEELEERGIPLNDYSIASFYSVKGVAQQARFARDLARGGVQIVHAYSFYGNVFAVGPARLARTQVVIASIRDRGAYLSPLQRRVQRHVCRLAHCVLANADSVKDWLVADGYDPASIRVIHNGVDLSRFNGTPNAGRVRQELGLPAEAPIVAVVSRLNRMKGLEQFIQAAPGVLAAHPDTRFLIVGETPPFDRPYLDELKSLAERCGVGERVIFTGLRADVPELLASATVAVMPSLNEALSNSLLESMAAGAPTVATRVGGTPEALADGETGLLVEPGDVEALGRAINRLLAAPELAARLGAAARTRIEQRFSIARMVAATAQLYEELLLKNARAQRHGSRKERVTMSGSQAW